MTAGRIHQDSDFAIQDSSVLWRRIDGMMLMLAHASKDDINYLENIGFCGTPGNPALYEVTGDMSRDCDEILIYDGQGNLLHRMEDKDGVHRGTTQKVHGSAAGSSSGSQSTGTFIAQSPGFITWSNPSNTGSYSINQAGSITYGASQAVTMPGSTPGYAFGYGVAQVSNPGVGYLLQSEVKKKIKDEGIRLGEIVAYRCWPIKNGFLWSTAADRAWAPGEPMKAGENHIRDGLGVYAFKEMSRCVQEFGAENFYRCGVAYGSVVLWGEIVEHQLGYRAEYAAVRSIEFVRNVDAQFWRPESVANLRALYKVEGK